MLLLMGDFRLIRLIRLLGFIVPLLFLFTAGCASHQPLNEDQTVRKIEALSRDLLKLHHGIDHSAAQQVAAVAVEYTNQLADRYRISGSPRQHNLLVNLGIRERGLCFHWTDDLLEKLQEMDAKQFDFHSAVAFKNSDLREHSSVVVTFKGAPFASGIVLDGWRHSGNLYWSRVRSDRYDWSPRYSKSSAKPVAR